MRQGSATHARNSRVLLGVPGRSMLLLAAWLGASCRSDSRKYEPAGMDHQVTIAAEDLGAKSDKLAPEGRHVWDESASSGRFPGGVAIAQVAAGERPTDGIRLLHAESMPTERGVLWGHLFDELPAVREVVLVERYGLDPRGFGYREVLRRAGTMSCGLCLIYARIDDTAYHAEYVAALFDTASEMLLITYRVPIELTLADCDGDEKAFEEGRLKKEWLFEADFRAEADLRRMVREDIWSMATRDKPASTQPNPWKSDQPLLPRDLGRWKFLLLPERMQKP